MIENRIVGYGEENPEELLANPYNWRIHPSYQQEAMSDALDELGWLSRPKINRVTGHIVNGHLRVMEAMKRGEASIPVAYIELTETEELEILATFDAITGLAGKDEARAQALADRVQARSNSLKLLVENLRPPQPVSKGEAKATIAQERKPQANAIFAIGEFRIILPQAELSQWWDALLAQHEGNRPKAIAYILSAIGLELETTP